MTGDIGSVAELVATARQHLAKFKVPRTIHVVEALPRDAEGHLLRSELARGMR